MLELLPPDLRYLIGEFAPLPYYLHPPPAEQWSLVRPHLPATTSEPIPTQVRLLWRYWNYQRFTASHAERAVTAGLNYVPLIKQFLFEYTDTADAGLAGAIIANGDENLFTQVLLPVLVDEGDQLQFGSKADLLLEASLLADNYTAVTAILGILAEHEDEPMGNRSYALIQSSRAFLYKYPRPLSSAQITQYIELMRDNEDEQCRVLAPVTLLSYGSPQSEFFKRAFFLLTDEELEDCAGHGIRNLVRREDLSLAIILLARQNTLEMRLTLLRVLFRNTKVSDTYAQQLFTLCYCPLLDVGAMLAELRVSANIYGISTTPTVAQHLRFVKLASHTVELPILMSQFIRGLKPTPHSEWTVPALISVFQALNPTYGPEELRELVPPLRREA
jgi:hypothetical protein